MCRKPVTFSANLAVSPYVKGTSHAHIEEGFQGNLKGEVGEVVKGAAEALQLLLSEGQQILQKAKLQSDEKEKSRSTKSKSSALRSKDKSAIRAKKEEKTAQSNVLGSDEAQGQEGGRSQDLEIGPKGYGGEDGANWLEFRSARDFVRELGLQDQKAWRDWCRKGDMHTSSSCCAARPVDRTGACVDLSQKIGLRPTDVPSHPDKAYKASWLSWRDWLGTSCGQRPRATKQVSRYPDQGDLRCPCFSV